MTLKYLPTTLLRGVSNARFRSGLDRQSNPLHQRVSLLDRQKCVDEKSIPLAEDEGR
jgi:hypothetical protein